MSNKYLCGFCICPQGAGAAATWTSNLSILMAKFPERKSTVKAWCDASFNFGLTIGPVLGALMYDAGGFFLPFAVTGTAILLSGLVVLLITEVSHNPRRCSSCRSPSGHASSLDFNLRDPI